VKHIVGFSGGIDSQAALLWVRNRYPKEDVIALNTEAGRNESPLTVAFIKAYSQDIFPVHEVVPLISDLWADGSAVPEKRGLDGSAELTFTEMIRIKGRAPSRTRQFCTTFLKLIPQRRWIRENVKDDYFERYSGVRRDESEARKDTLIRYWDDFNDCWVNNPLADWTKKMCFDYVAAHHEPINPLYRLGFNRVGCAPCINAGKDDILNWFERFPEQLEMVRDREKATHVTYFAPLVPGMAMNFVDDVIAWAKTSHGGKQFRILPEREACESKYGLCE
jgi:3'-phosphoadenosine 5'-phosphosulfate sulfotransferase (PAPS reductase)/FAD synthetase